MALKPLPIRRSFYQQVRVLLRHISRQQPDVTPDKEALLQSSLNLISPMSLDAPPDEVSDIQQRNGRWQVIVWRGGLTGALGTLPTAYSQWLIERFHRRGERAAKSFFDIFTHRMQVLRFLAWEKCRLYARAELRDDMPLSQPTKALSGILNVKQCSTALSWRYAMLLSLPVRSLSALEEWLRHLFGIPVAIQPFMGSWQTVDECWMAKLGSGYQPLGNAPVLGTQRWDLVSAYRLLLGPLNQQQVMQFMPGGEALQLLHHCLQHFTCSGIRCDIQLIVVEPQAVPNALSSCKLGECATLGRGETHREIFLPWEIITCQG